MMPKSMSSDLIREWTHTHPDQVRVQAFRHDIMPNSLESITFMRFDQFNQNASCWDARYPARLNTMDTADSSVPCERMLTV